MAGRKTKLTPALQAKFCNAIQAGNYYNAACAYANICTSTFYRWMEKGAKEKNGKYRDFRDAVTRAEQQAEVRMVTEWQAHMPKDYRAIRDFLERRFPERWSKRVTMHADPNHRGEVVRRGQHEIYIKQEILNDPESRELVKRLIKRQEAIKREKEC